MNAKTELLARLLDRRLRAQGQLLGAARRRLSKAAADLQDVQSRLTSLERVVAGGLDTPEFREALASTRLEELAVLQAQSEKDSEAAALEDEIAQLRHIKWLVTTGQDWEEEAEAWLASSD